MKQYVIIGNGVAAAACIEGIRHLDKDSPIVVISKEQYPVYCRPLISYYLEHKTDLDRIQYRTPDFYQKNQCRVLYGETAASIDTAQKQVLLQNGDAIPYTDLCIAAGSSPFTPPFEGLETVPQRFCFMTLEDTLALESALTPKSRVLIMGAGLIGLKCAEGLHGRVGSITICDLADRILPSVLDADTASIVQQHLEEHDIDFLLSDSVARFEGSHAILQSGRSIDFDILITAVGVRPNAALAADAGADVKRGICVDAHMRTTLSNIYAAGDCVESYDIASDTTRVLALLPNAYMQGYTAGINMAGGDSTFSNAIAMNSIGLLGLPIMTAGTYPSHADDATVYRAIDKKTAKEFFIQDGLLKGFILIGNVIGGGLYTSLVRNRIPLDTIQFDLLEENPTYTAFCEKDRKAMFGGVV